MKSLAAWKQQALPLLLILINVWTTSVTGNKVRSYPVRSKAQLQRHLPHRRATTPEEAGVYEGDETHDGIYRGLGTHYVNLHVGCPPQIQTVIIDTGSSITGFPCESCRDNCGEGYHLNPPYQESESSCFNDTLESCRDCVLQPNYARCMANDACIVSAAYAEGSSWDGVEVTDVVAVGGDTLHPDEEQSPMRFVCQSSITNLFVTQLADGITGLSKSATATLWGQMYDQGAIDRRQFSLCFQNEQEQQEDAGILVLGGVDERLYHYSPMAFAREIPTQSQFWRVRIRKIYAVPSSSSSLSSAAPVHEASLGSVPSSSLLPIVDSGTTYTYLDLSMRDPLEAVWDQFMDVRFGVPLEMEESELALLPTFLFQLEGVEENASLEDAPGVVGADRDGDFPDDIFVAFPPWRYMQKATNSDVYYWAVFFDGGSNSVLGANFISGHDVLFDYENGRIGFAESDCVLNGTESETGGLATSPPSEQRRDEDDGTTTSSSRRRALDLAAVVGCVSVVFLAECML